METRAKMVSDAEQIAAIDAAIANGWEIVEASRDGYFGKVRAIRMVRRPDDLINPRVFAGYETVSQEWGCSIAAAQYAETKLQSR